VVICTILIGCRNEPLKDFHPILATSAAAASTGVEYRLGVPPMRPTRALWARYSPVVDDINSQIPEFQLRLESALTPGAYDNKLQNAELDIALVEPHRVLDFEVLGYRVFARTGRGDRISGVLVVTTGGTIRRIKDLAGRTMSLSSRIALASSLVIADLKESGLDAAKVNISSVENEESALMNVFAGEADAAGVSRAAWERYRLERPESAEHLRVLRRTQDLPGVAVMAHKRIPKAHIQQLAKALVLLADCEAGRAALERAGFTEFRYGESASYDDLWEFFVKYRRMFGSGPKGGSS
jgi:hypothetical protein